MLKQLLIVTILISLIGCQATSKGDENDLLTNHVPSTGEFILTTPLNKTYQSGENLDITLTFPKAVTVSGTPSLTLQVGTSNREALYVSGTGTNSLIFRYTIVTGDNDLDGVSLPSSINLNGGGLTYAAVSGAQNCQTTLRPPSSPNLRIDTVAPTISSLSPPANGTYFLSMPLNFSVTFSEAVTVSGSPRLPFTIGATTRYATYISGSGSTQLIFSYFVSGSDSDLDGINLSGQLDLNGGSIKDSVSPSTLTYSSPNTSAILVAGDNPVVTHVAPPTTGTYLLNQHLDFVMTFSEVVNVSASPQLSLTVGTTTRYAPYLSGSGTKFLVFRYTVQSGDNDTNGISLSPLINLNGGLISDTNSNPAITALIPPDLSQVLVSTVVVGEPVAINSTITGTSQIIANGISSSTVTITLKDANNNPVPGKIPTFSATDSSGTNAYEACTTTNALGSSTCSLKSTKAETKTLSILTPVVKAGDQVVFTAGPAVIENSSISGTGPVIADGVATSSVTISFKDAYNNPVSGVTPTFSATNTNSVNTYSACNSSDQNGEALCTLKSTKAEVKTLSITHPFTKTGSSVTFISGPPSVSNSDIIGTSPVSADGVSASFITISLFDAQGNPSIGVTPIFNATDSGSNNTYGSCSVTNSNGVSSCTLSSTTAEQKTLQLTSPIALTGSATVTFSAQPPSAPNSTISGTGPVVADGGNSSTVTITLKDSGNNPVPGIVPTFDATNTGQGNTYEACSMSDAGGVSICALSSTKAEIKTLRITSPVIKSDGSVTFVAGPPVASNSSISGTGPVIADGSASSTITITLKDAFQNPVSGTIPTFSATNTSNANTQVACVASDSNGNSTCGLKSTKAEVKSIQILTPVSKSGTGVQFIAGAPVAVNSSIVGTGPVNPDGTSTSAITITLKDIFNNEVSGVTPTFSASGSNNIYGTCSSSSGSGQSSCTLASIVAETKTLSITSPFNSSGGIVIFQSGSAVVANSSITATGPVLANNVATSSVSITLKDSNNVPVVGIVPTFSASGSDNTYDLCTSTNTSGIATCTLRSTKAESKILSLTSPVVKTGDTVEFTAGAPSSLNSTIEVTDPNLANGTNAATVTISIRDAFNNPVQGVTPTYAVSGTSNNLSACSITNSSGLSTCGFTTTKAEAKTVSLVTPVSVTGNTADFNTSGINIMVPIEMIDRGLASSTSSIIFNRSLTTLNPADYVSESNTYYFEVVAENINPSVSYTVQLVDSNNNVISDSTITVPQASAPRRLRRIWTPNSTDDTYRIQLSATASSSQLRVHSAKILVAQQKAVETKIYFPLAGGDVTGDTNVDTSASITSTTGTSFGQPNNTNFYHWVRNDSAYDAIAADNPWTLETVMSTSSTLGTASAALFDKGNNAQISGASLSVTGTTAMVLSSVSFPSNASGFNDSDTLELRIRSNSASYTARLFKAGLWLKLKYLKKLELFQRLSNRRSSTVGATIPDGRLLWEPSQWSNPATFFQTVSSTITSSVDLVAHGSNDFGTTSATTLTSMTPPATYSVLRSSQIYLTDQTRYWIQHNVTAGTSNLGGAFLVIKASE
jgi:hypothetical protein